MTKPVCLQTTAMQSTPPLFRDTSCRGSEPSLRGDGSANPAVPTKSKLAKAIVMRAIARLAEREPFRALPKWRQKSFNTISRQYRAVPSASTWPRGGPLENAFLASVSRRDRVQAAQYLLLTLVDTQSAMLDTAMPLVEVAFSVGFSAH